MDEERDEKDIFEDRSSGAELQSLVTSVAGEESPLSSSVSKRQAKEKPCGKLILGLGIGSIYLNFVAVFFRLSDVRPDSIARPIRNVEAPLVFAVAVALGLWAWILGVREMRRMNTDRTPHEFRGFSIAGMVLGIITAGGLFLMFAAFLTCKIVECIHAF